MPRKGHSGVGEDASQAALGVGAALVASWCALFTGLLLYPVIANFDQVAISDLTLVWSSVLYKAFISIVLFLFGWHILLGAMTPVLVLSRWPACRGWLCRGLVGACDGMVFLGLWHAAGRWQAGVPVLSPSSELEVLLGVGAISGLVGGSVYWAIRRPDRAPKRIPP